MMNMTEEQFRDLIFDSNTAVFGDVGEEMIRHYFHLQKSNTKAYDATDQTGRLRIEIKASRVLKKPTKSGNLLRRLLENTTAKRLLSSFDALFVDFDCNIEQVKPAQFDYLYYALFFSDCIEIFGMSSGEVSGVPRSSDKQHMGNDGEGQFHINSSNIAYHRENFYKKTITYAELYNNVVDPGTE